MFKMTNSNGVAAVTRANEDRIGNTEDVIQYCWGSASNQCRFSMDISSVTSIDPARLAGIVFADYVLPTSPKQIVRTTCNCDPCGQGPSCPKMVDYPGCNAPPTTINLRPARCNVPYTKSICDPRVMCANGAGALCTNAGCPYLNTGGFNYVFCSFGDAPQNQLKLSFECPANGFLHLRASLERPGRDPPGAPSCGIGPDGMQLRTESKAQPGTVTSETYGFGAQRFELDQEFLCISSDVVYTVTENVGIFLTDSISATFRPIEAPGS